MAEMIGPFNGRGKMRVPAPHKVGLQIQGGLVSREGTVARAIQTNGTIKVAGSETDALLATGRTLVLPCPDETRATKLYDSIHKLWSDVVSTKVEEAFKQVIAKNPRLQHGIMPISVDGKILHYNTAEWAYYMMDKITWAHLLNDIQHYLTFDVEDDITGDEDLDTLGPKDRSTSPRRIGIGLGLIFKQNGTWQIRKRPGRIFKIGDRYLKYRMKQWPYLPKEEKVLYRYLGYAAKCMKTTYGKWFPDLEWSDWVSIVATIIHQNKPGGTVNLDRVEMASDLVESIFDYIGQEQCEAYKHTGPCEHWLETEVALAFCIARVGIYLADFELYKEPGSGSSWQMRGEIGFVLENTARWKGLGNAEPFFPPARNTSDDCSWIPVHFKLDKDDSDCAQLETTDQAELGPATTVPIKRNEADAGSLDVAPSQAKEVRYQYVSDTRIIMYDTNRKGNILMRIPIGIDPEPAENVMVKFIDGAVFYSEGYYMSARYITPYLLTGVTGATQLKNVETKGTSTVAQPGPGLATLTTTEATAAEAALAAKGKPNQEATSPLDQAKRDAANAARPGADAKQ